MADSGCTAICGTAAAWRISSRPNKALLLEYGAAVGIAADRLQFKPLKDPRTGIRRDAWHWDLGGPVPAADRDRRDR